MCRHAQHIWDQRSNPGPPACSVSTLSAELPKYPQPVHGSSFPLLEHFRTVSHLKLRDEKNERATRVECVLILSALCIQGIDTPGPGSYVGRQIVHLLVVEGGVEWAAKQLAQGPTLVSDRAGTPSQAAWPQSRRSSSTVLNTWCP